MDKNEYSRLQADLDKLIKNMHHKSYNAKERRVYEEAVLAAKSVVSNYNPDRIMERAKRYTTE